MTLILAARSSWVTGHGENPARLMGMAVPPGAEMAFGIHRFAAVAANRPAGFDRRPYVRDEDLHLLRRSPVADHVWFFPFLDQLIGDDHDPLRLVAKTKPQIAHAEQRFKRFAQP